MSSYESDRERWLEQELTGVPLPKGMIARLKKICAGDDSELDIAICDVHVPEGLRTKLKNIPVDEKLARALRKKVVVPDDLLARLKEIPDLEVAEVLKAEKALAGHVLRQWVRSPMVRWAVAASLLTAVGLVGLGTLGDFFQTAQRGDPQADISAPFVLASTLPEQESPEQTASQKTASQKITSQKITSPTTAPSEEADTNVVESDAPSPETLLVTPAPKILDIAAPVEDFQPPWVDPHTFVTDDSDETVSELERVEGLVPRGVAPPPVMQYPRLQLIKDGVHPFVSPAAHQELKTSRVPLITQATSYHVARRNLHENRLPSPEEIRPEGFLAGVNYQFRRPHNLALGIRTAAGPSPFGAEGMQLLQVAVRASNGSPRKKQGTALTLAIDISANMEHGDRLMMVRRVLTDLARQLGPRDRMSLVAFSERSDVLIVHAGRDRAEGLVAAIGQLTPDGTTNLTAGLQAASEIALGEHLDEGVTARLVLLTDRVGYVPDSTIVQLEELAAQTAAGGVRLDVIDLGHDEAGDPRLRDLARAGRGQVKAAHNVEEIRYALTEILTGESPLIATGARLTVRFNPKVVAEYRLIGHEADMVGGLLSGSLSTSFNVGETATVLFELRLHARGGDDVAAADLRWQDAETGEKHNLTQRISRVQFATTLVEAPLSLQMAAIVAESAEVLRGSVYAPNYPAALGDVLEVSNSLHPRVYENPSFVEFLTTIEQAHRLRTAKSPPRRNPPRWLWRLRHP